MAVCLRSMSFLKTIRSYVSIILSGIAINTALSQSNDPWVVSREAAPPVAIKLGQPLERPFELDFRYQPPLWQSTICLPDDWQKSLVNKDGTILCHYHGIDSQFRTEIGCGVDGLDGKWISQEYDDPKVPVYTTTTRSGELDVRTTAIGLGADWVKPLKPQMPKFHRDWQSRLIEPVNPQTHVIMLNQSHPTKPSALCFTSTDNSWSGPLKYRFPAASTSATYHIVFGFCCNSKPGENIQEIRVEGELRQTIDLVAATSPLV